MEEYLNFVHYCIDEKQRIPSISEWDALFLFMQQQALLGVGFRGLERMKQAGVDVPKDVVLRWYAMSEQVKRRNEEMNKRCVELTEMLKKDGFESCILKGQGNARLYPDPFSRQTGDIDVWVKPVKGLEFRVKGEGLSIDERRKVVTKYVRGKFPKTEIRYQHIEFPVFKDVEVEVHFIPTAKNNPVYNHRIQRWAEERMAEQYRHFVVLPNTDETVCVPTVDFNVVYQLSHLMHHFFDEGVGLRQMMDYYYLLRKAKDESEKLIVKSEKFFDENSGLKSGNLNAGHVGSEGLELRDESLGRGEDDGLELRVECLESSLNYLGLYKFAGAVMWVLHEALGLEEEYMIAPMDEWRGKLLLDEILKGGNFGHYSGLTNHSTGTKYFLKIKRNMRFVRAYPSEALCEPLFRTWHFFWRVFVKFRV